MHLPDKYSGEFSIDYDKNIINEGTYLYYPIDGTLHYVKEVTPTEFILHDEWQNEQWAVEGYRFRSNLFEDFFPLKQH